MITKVLRTRSLFSHARASFSGHNFIRDDNFQKGLGSRGDSSAGEEHSLLPYLYLYQFFSDNVGYVLMEPRTRQLIAVDVGEFETSYKVISELENRYNTELKYILSTHHHHDHIGGNQQWKQARPKLQIVAGSLKPDGIPGANILLNDLQTLEVGDICITCMETPGHTKDHVSYIVTHVTPESTKYPFLFCADTLFIGGCGRLLGGTAEQLFYSLQKLINLPNDTLVFCAHEYTLSNLRFAKHVEPSNPYIDMKISQVERIRALGEFSVGSKLAEEKSYNPFIRCAREEHFKQITGEQDPVRVFAKVRKLKDSFK